MRDFRTLLKRIELENKSDEESEAFIDIFNKYRSFEHIKVDRYILSVQGNEGTYSKPRLTLDAFAYTQYEIAVLNHNDLMDIRHHMHFKDLKICKYHDGFIAGYVPIKVIQELFERLLKLDRKSKIKRIL